MARGDYQRELELRNACGVALIRTYFCMRNSDHEFWGVFAREACRAGIAAIRSTRNQLRALNSDAGTAATAAER